MSFWRRWFGDDDARAATATTADGAQATAAEDANAPRPPTAERDAELEALAAQLGRLGQADGPSSTDALRTLRSFDRDPNQPRLVRAVARALGAAEASQTAAFAPVRLVCARLLDEQGQSARALELVGNVPTREAMMLAADLHARRGDLARAVSTIERVLVRDIDTPGARERHRRWCQQLGHATREPTAEQADATVITPAAQTANVRLLREVSRGGAGTIYEAEDALLGRRLAYKIYHRGEAEHAQIRREARTAIALRGPGVIRIYDADPSAGWLASEWCAEGSLRDRLLPERAAELLPVHRWLVPLLTALCRVHEAGWVHSDLKPANVLFRRIDDPVLIDFGVCLRTAERGVAGTPGYLAPERLAGDAADPRDDVYAVGRIIEDVLEVVDGENAEALSQLAKVALSCLGAAEHRPADAGALLELLRE